MLRRMVLAGLCTVTLVSALAAAVSWPRSSSSAEVDEVGAPVLSPRRLPDLLAAASTDSSTRSQIRNVLSTGIAANGRYCLVVHQSGRPILLHEAGEPMAPASTLKVLTALAGLSVFGPDATFETKIVASAKPVDGVIEGPIYFVGGGDPLILTADYVSVFPERFPQYTPIEAFADQLASKGVRRILGGVFADDSRFDDQRYVASWDPGYWISGQVGPVDALLVNQGFSRYRGGRAPSQDPSIYAASTLTEVLRSRGIEVVGEPGRAVRPKDTETLASLRSAPLSALADEMLTQSDNTTAEMLLKTISTRGNQIGSTSASIDITRNVLAREGLSTAGLTMVDGSGLDRGNRVPCAVIEAALSQDGPNGLLARGLAKAGETGTLENRLVGTPATGRVRAKTGTLQNVSALAGWAAPDASPPVSFSIMFNGIDVSTARTLEDRFAVLLATLPHSQSPIAYAPDAVIANSQFAKSGSGH